MESYSNSYKEAGVDVTKGYEAVKLMKQHVERTRVPGVADEIGGFGGMFIPNLTGISEPVLVSGTDGVGTKLKIAFMMDIHNTVGIDCVAMCVNDIICAGARPLFFLDYIACGKNVPEKIAEIVSGVAEGCVQSGAALIGGETAEHPGMMPVEDYDLAGFAVGIVDKKKIIDNTTMKAGDVVIALASTGVHSNGFSLCRKVFDIDNNPPSLYVPCDELGGKSIGETLLTPTRIYVKSVLALLEKVNVKGISHITGGGFYENIPRSIPEGLGARVRRADVKVLPIFDLIAKTGSIPERDMFNTYNMGVGMSIVVSPEDVETVISIQKILDNKSGETMGLNGFIFQLLEAEAQEAVTATSDDEGKAEFRLSFSAADVGKTYIYKLSEKAGDVEGMTYDDTVYEIKVVVSQNAETGELLLTVTRDDEAIDGSAEFTNVYAPVSEPEEDPEEPPKTADGFNMALWSTLCLGAAVMLAGLVVGKKRFTK